MSEDALTIAADLTLIAHAAFIVFVVGGQGLILAGWMLGWRWPRNPPFRFAHAGAIALVVLESWFGIHVSAHLAGAPAQGGGGKPPRGRQLRRLLAATADLLRRPLVGVHPGLHVFAAVVAATLVFYPPRRRAARRARQAPQASS